MVLVQDLHLCLLAEPLAVSRPDLDLVHFSHTPFAGPDDLRVLPDDARTALLRGMAGHRACGFHTARWRDAFVASCRADGVEPPATFVAPLGPDVDDIGGVAAGAGVRGRPWPTSRRRSGTAASSPGSTASSCRRT